MYARDTWNSVVDVRLRLFRLLFVLRRAIGLDVPIETIECMWYLCSTGSSHVPRDVSACLRSLCRLEQSDLAQSGTVATWLYATLDADIVPPESAVEQHATAAEPPVSCRSSPAASDTVDAIVDALRAGFVCMEDTSTTDWKGEFTVHRHEVHGEVVREVRWRTSPSSVLAQLALAERCFKEATRRIKLVAGCTSGESILHGAPCGICGESIPDTATVTQCGHAFHPKCIRDWSRAHSPTTCFTCRRPFFFDS